MTRLINKEKNAVIAEEHIINAHQFLLDFLAKYDHAKRGGVHDFMEISMFNMINAAIKRIDDYLSSGHIDVDATQIMYLVADAYQGVLESIKRNLETMDKVHLQ